MKMKNLLLPVFLTASILFSFTGCAGSSGSNDSTKTAENTEESGSSETVDESEPVSDDEANEAQEPVSDDENNEAQEPVSDDEAVVIRVGYFGTPQYQTQLAIAKENGYFDEAFADMNVEVEYNFFAGAGPAINEALLAGDLDVAFGVGDQPTLSGISNGNGDVIISRIVKNAKGSGLLARNGSGIESLEDLKGKKIAVGVGTANQKIVDLFLADVGLTEDDVELVNVSAADDQLAALASGEIDAAYTSNLAYCVEKAEESEIASLLTDCTDHPNYAYLSIKQEFIDAHEEVVRKFTDALYKADQWYAQNQEEGIQIVADFLDTDYETAAKGNQTSDIGMDLNDEDIEDLKVTYDFMEVNDLLNNKIEDITSIINDSFIKQAMEEN